VKQPPKVFGDQIVALLGGSGTFSSSSFFF
jgi:hypothetical protein